MTSNWPTVLLPTVQAKEDLPRQKKQAMFQILSAKGDLFELARGDPARPQIEVDLIPLHAQKERARSGKSSASLNENSRCLQVRGIINLRISRST